MGGRLEDFARGPFRLATEHVAFAADGDLHLCQIVHIADHIGLLQFPVLPGQPVFQSLAQHQRQKGALPPAAPY